MNYHETKDSAASDFIDSDNSDASIRFCLESDLVPKPDFLFFSIYTISRYRVFFSLALMINS